MVYNKTYQVTIKWSDEDNAFIAKVANLEGVTSHGDTFQGALDNVTEAVELHLESLKAEGLEVPDSYIFAVRGYHE